MEQSTSGNITVTELTKGIIAVSLGTDLDSRGTEIFIKVLNKDYIDDMIAALKMYKNSLN